MSDPVRTLVYHAHAHYVDTVIVDGKILVENGSMLSINENDVIAKAQDASDAL